MSNSSITEMDGISIHKVMCFLSFSFSTFLIPPISLSRPVHNVISKRNREISETQLKHCITYGHCKLYLTEIKMKQQQNRSSSLSILLVKKAFTLVLFNNGLNMLCL